MTNEQILKKAIEKAVKNGFKYEPYIYSDGVHSVITEINEIYIYRQIIFNHDFAKAFWGEEVILMCHRCGDEYKFTTEKFEKGCTICGTQLYQTANWKNKIQEMVLKEDPIKYLQEFI